MTTLTAAGQPRLAALDEVRNREEDTDKILSATGLVKALTAGLAALLVFASIALIANTIRLSVFARRREVEVMKLVGATNWFIRWPFVIEGVIVGFFGGLLAVLLLTIAKETFIDPLSDRFALLAGPGHDRLPAAGGAADARLDRRVGDRQRHHAAPLPARLAPHRRSRPAHYPGRLPWAPLASALIAVAAGRVSPPASGSAGTPRTCPDPVRDRSWTTTAPLRAEVLDTIEDNFYRPVDESELEDASLKGVVRLARRPLLALPHAEGGVAVPRLREGEFEGVGMSVEEDERGLRVLRVFEGSPGAPRRHPARAT